MAFKALKNKLNDYSNNIARELSALISNESQVAPASNPHISEESLLSELEGYYDIRCVITFNKTTNVLESVNLGGKEDSEGDYTGNIVINKTEILTTYTQWFILEMQALDDGMVNTAEDTDEELSMTLDCYMAPTVILAMMSRK